jgi:hypothetical protein
MSEYYIIYDTPELASADHDIVCQQEGIPRPETKTYKAYDWLPAKTGTKVYVPDNYFLQTYYSGKTRVTWADLVSQGIV